MRIVHVLAILAKLPLVHPMKHAGGEYRETETLFVCCRLADGTEGWGEGVPRSHLTGQSPEQAWHHLVASLATGQLSRNCENWADVVRMCLEFRVPADSGCYREGFDHPIRCGVELAVLDAFGRYFRQSIKEAAYLLPSVGEMLRRQSAVRYSATIMAADPITEALRALFIRWYGFRECKIKVGLIQDYRREVKRIGRLRRLLGHEMDIRLDANGAWKADDLPQIAEALLLYRISCIEDPVSPAEVARLAQLRKRLPIPIMLDDTVISFADVDRVIAEGLCDLINIRLSKCGGFLRSLQMAAQARKGGLGIQLGCHPGESGILSAAGRHFAALLPNLRYREGSYDRFIFRRLITKEDLTFGWGGVAPDINGPGLGVTVDRRRLAPYIVRQQGTFLL